MLASNAPIQDTLFPSDLLAVAASVLDAAKNKNVRIATAETVTSGLVSACLTSVPGASDIFERGFILYHSSAKSTGLGVDESVSSQHGAVSAEVTVELAKGLLSNSTAFITLAVTGYAGPGGGSAKNPVGTIFIAGATRHGATQEERHVFSGNRDQVRLQAIQATLELAKRMLSV